MSDLEKLAALAAEQCTCGHDEGAGTRHLGSCPKYDHGEFQAVVVALRARAASTPSLNAEIAGMGEG